MATSSSPVTAATNAVAKGTVVFVQGEAYLRDSSGKLSAIKPGDVVTEGQEIVTRNGAVVELQLPSGAKVSVGPNRELLLNDEFFATATPERSENVISSLGADADKVIQALNAGKDPFEDLEDPAAGLTGSGLGDQTHDFVRLVRVLEEVTPVAYNYSTTADGVEFLPAATITTQTINTPPVATDDSVAGTEDQPLTVDVLANDSDANNDPLVVTSATANNGQVTINPDGSLRYVPNPDFNGPDTVTYTISDGKGGTSTATVTINVAAVNDAPVALPDVATTPEDEPVTVNVLGNDSDPDGDPLTVTGATVDPARGTVVVNPDGTLTFTPAPDITGPVVITYTVSDGKGGTASSTVTVNVTPVNDNPVANPDVATTLENTPVTVPVLGNDSDPEGNPLTVTGATVNPTLGTVVVNPDGTLTFTPAANVNGPVVINYTISDGQGGTATSTVTVNVTPDNAAPVASPDSATTLEDQTVTINVLGNDNDPDGDPLSVTGATVDPAKGTVVVNPDGTLSFNPAANVNGPVVVTYTISDGKGGTATSTVTIDVTPQNDAPVANPDSTSTQEDQPVTVNVLGNDTDPDGDTLTVTGATVDPAKGAVVVNPDGTLTFTPAANINGPVVVTYTVADGNGGTATSTVTIDVTPDADDAVLGTGSGGVKEDTPAQSTASGTLSIVDPDAGEAIFQAQTNVAGTYGAFSVNTAGAWTYTIDNTLPVVQALKEGETRTESFTVRSADGTATTVSLTILGTNDGPVANPNTATTPEEQSVTVNVLGNDTDPDGDPLSVSGATVDPAKGTVAVNADGTLTFTPAANVNGPVIVTYTIADGHGGSATSSVTINVTPINDNATISAGTGTTQEDTVLLASGTLTINDPDAGEAAFQAQTGTAGTYGSFSIDETGHWAFTLDNGNPLVQNLADGESRTESFTVRSVDGTESTVVVTIFGTNETIGAPGVGIVKEDNTLTTGGNLTASGGASFVPQPATPGTYGNFTLNPDGTWSYALNNPASVVQSLGEGQTRTETFPVSLSDGTSSTITITVVGTNDPALIGPGSGNVTEDSVPSTGGTLSIIDVDGGEAGFQPQTSVAGTYGSFSLDAAGNWTYTLNNAHPDVQALGVGDTLSETFPVLSTDGTSSNVVVTINGTNDGPVANPNAATTPEEQPVTINVLGNDTDPDGDTLTVTGATVDPTKGSVVVNADGTLTFTPAANVNGPVVVTYTINDGHGGTASSTVTINVTPVADTAVLGTGSGAVKEDTPAQSTASGTLSIVDPDAGEAVFQAQTNTAGTYGSFSVNTAGAWTYTIDNTLPVVQALKEGETRTESFTVRSADGTATTVSLTILGTNDGPVANPNTATTPEDQPVTFNVLGNDTDPDGDFLSVTGATVDPAKGTVAVNPDGTLTFNPAANVNGPVVVTYTIADGKGGTATSTVTIDVTPENDAPVALNDANGLVKTDTTPATGNVITNPAGLDSDLDGDTLTVSQVGSAPVSGATVVTGAYGTLTIQANGDYSYIQDTANSTVSGLAPGATLTDSFTYTVSDGKGGTATAELQITIAGLNTPPIANPDSATTNEDEPIRISVLGNDTDPEGDPLSITSATVDPTKGSVVINSDGTLTFNPAPNFNGPVVVTYTVSDGKGGTATSTVNIAVTPLNDAPVANPNTATTLEDQPVTVNVLGNDTDPDGDTLTVTGATVDPAKGTVAVNPDGTLTFNPAANVNGPVVVTYTIADGKGGTASTTVTINVTPVNDAPVAVNDLASTSEDAPVSRSAALGVLANDSDIDSASLSVSGVRVGTSGAFTAPGAAGITLTGTYGTLLIRADGSYTYTPGAAAQALNTGDSVQDVFSYQLSDGSLTAVANLSITVTGANDAAVITGLAAGTVKEDTAGQLTATGTLAATDVDSPATFTPASAAGTYGSFSIAANGTWTYTLSNAAANVQALREGDTRTETFVVTTADGTARNVVVTVLGTNEIPTVANVSATGTEDPSSPIPVVIAGNDVDGSVTSLTLADLPANGTLYRDAAMTQPVTAGTPISAGGGAVTLYFQPGANWNGSTSFHFTATDNNGGSSSQATASITVTPVADAAVLGTGSGAVKEDTPAQSTASGTLSIVDPDAGEAVFQAQTNTAGTYGSFSVNTAGAWTYTIDNTLPVVQALKEGETRTESFTVRSADGTATTVSLTILGTNDGPVANPNTATTPEDQPVTINVLGNDTDPDGDTLTVTSASVPAAKGTIVVNADGTLTFTPAPNVTGPIDVTYTIADGKGGTASSSVSINVTPVNDAPVAVNDLASTSEDAPVSHSAALGVLANDSDIDSASLSVSGVRVGTSGAFTAPGAAGITLTGTYGTLLIRADGSYTYTPGAAAQALNTGDSVQDVFSYQLSDGSLTAVANLSITVTGANDAAVITGLATGSVKEDTAGQLTTTGTLSATDVDSSTTFNPANAAGTYGNFSVAANGTWTYTLNNSAANVQALREGDTRTETFTATTADGTPRSITVTVLGTNEIPTVANVLASGAEDPAAPIPVTLAGTDVDGSIASLTLADLPANGTLYRDAAMTQPVSAGTPMTATGGAVTLYFQPGANWNGSTNFHFTATDNNGGNSSQATATLNVTPVNDPPVAIADSGSTNQNTPLTHAASSGVLTNDSDIDGGTLNVSGIAAGNGTSVPVTSGGTTVTGAFGTLLIAPDGSYTYTPGDAAKALTLGQSANDVFSYTVSDGNGGTATTTLTIQVSGLNDAPVIGGIATGNVTEDGTLTAGGSLTISDADAGQSSFVPQTLSGTYGTLSLQANGSWSYSLNNSATNVQSLKQGEVVQDHFSVHTADGTAKDVTINVTGTNDAPVVGTATVSVSEEGLAGGIADTTGTTDTTNLATAGGVISVADVDGNPLSVTLTAPTTALTSNGVAITWTGSGTQTLVGSAGSLEIIRATIANNGTQSVTLSGPIDHTNTTQEDVLTLNLGVNVSDGVTTTTSTLAVRVEDDAPKATSVTQAVEVPPQDTNLLIILDNSGSMNTADGVGGATRLQSAIAALNQLINTYDSLGEVRIRIVTFNSGATALGTTWTTVDLGKTQLAGVVQGGTTNYDAAILTAQTAYTSTGKLASGQNVAYFLSDGIPNTGTAIGTADETAWKSFLTSNGITSYALGMGTGATQGPLDPIAYNGLTGTNLNAQVISDFSQLSNALQATIPQSATGDILSGGLLGGSSGFGGDGGHISSITVEGVTYTYNPTGATSIAVSGGASQGTYDPATHQLTVRTDDGGTLVVNMSTGSYNYTPRPTVTTPIVDGFSFVLADKDGDTASASVTFNVSREAESVVTLTSTTRVIDSASLGLTGEYYGYNETTAGVTRTHADDTTLGNLNNLADMTAIVDGRSGETVLGTYDAAPVTGSDATFSADKIDYGFGYTTGTTSAAAVNGNLGNNPTLGANMAVNSGALYNFLRGGTTGADAATLTTTTGVGNTTDSGLRFVGMMNVGGGIYDIRVTADDGFRINIGGQTVATFNDIQSPTARTYTGISLESGLQPIEIVYWEQGGNARLRIEVKLSSEADTAYKTLGTDEFALFTPTSAPVLTELQDIVESTTNGTWLVRTGERLDGTDGNDHITGSAGQDVIYGGAGNDTITGGSGASLISGGAGNDTLTGGLGSDTFQWSLGDAGTAGAPALDAITDFNKAAAISGGDVLDLGDLLQGESHTGTNPGNLGSYLHFEKSGTDTVVHISSTGGYTGGTFSAGATDQKIVLQGVDLTNAGALSTDAQIIQDLLTKGKLSAD